MLRSCLFLSALLVSGLPNALADTVQLKDKAAITGKVLVEKSDQVAVDVGYTVLVIPRNQVVKIIKSEPAAPIALIWSSASFANAGVPAVVMSPAALAVGVYAESKYWSTFVQPPPSVVMSQYTSKPVPVAPGSIV